MTVATLTTQYSADQQKPLGQERLLALDLVSTLVQLPKQGTFVSLKINNVLLHVVNLLANHPWNNFAQIHVVQVFEWMMKTPRLTAKERVALLKESTLLQCLIKLGS
jgi:hypothetical protein